MNIKFKLTKEQELFIKEGSKVIIRDHVPKGETPKPDRVFFFLPYWFEHIGKDEFRLHHLDHLPAELRSAIKEQRDRNNGYL